MIYYSTHKRQNVIYLFYTSKMLKSTSEKSGKNVLLLCDIICDLYSNTAHAQEPMKFLHLYELLYK